MGYREQDLIYSVFETAAGWAGISSSPAGLNRFILPRNTPQEATGMLGVSFNNRTKPVPLELKDVIVRLQRYFSGEPVSFPDKLDFTGATKFQCIVWETARRIPYGETRSYSWIAENIGNPKSARAVGNSLGLNRLPVIIPCHRVLHRDGGLGGFSGEPGVKRYLLRLENTLKS